MSPDYIRSACETTMVQFILLSITGVLGAGAGEKSVVIDGDSRNANGLRQRACEFAIVLALVPKNRA